MIYIGCNSMWKGTWLIFVRVSYFSVLVFIGLLAFNMIAYTYQIEHAWVGKSLFWIEILVGLFSCFFLFNSLILVREFCKLMESEQHNSQSNNAGYLIQKNYQINTVFAFFHVICVAASVCIIGYLNSMEQETFVSAK